VRTPTLQKSDQESNGPEFLAPPTSPSTSPLARPAKSCTTNARRSRPLPGPTLPRPYGWDSIACFVSAINSLTRFVISALVLSMFTPARA